MKYKTYPVKTILEMITKAIAVKREELGEAKAL
jgi:hypothetical protein